MIIHTQHAKRKVDKDTQRKYNIDMNIFKELNKLPQTDINEVSYGAKIMRPDYTRGATYEGKKLSVWANELGISYNLVFMRVKAGKHPALKGALKERTNGVSYEGKSVKQWADELNECANTIYRRIQAGKHPADRSRRKRCQKKG